MAPSAEQMRGEVKVLLTVCVAVFVCVCVVVFLSLLRDKQIECSEPVITDVFYSTVQSSAFYIFI